jgi:hypothetical protein
MTLSVASDIFGDRHAEVFDCSSLASWVSLTAASNEPTPQQSHWLVPRSLTFGTLADAGPLWADVLLASACPLLGRCWPALMPGQVAWPALNHASMVH